MEIRHLQCLTAWRFSAFQKAWKFKTKYLVVFKNLKRKKGKGGEAGDEALPWVVLLHVTYRSVWSLLQNDGQPPGRRVKRLCVSFLPPSPTSRKDWYSDLKPKHYNTSGQLHSSFRRGSVQFSSVAQSCLTLWPHELQHTRPPCPSPTPGVHSNSCPSRRWCHLAISSSVVPFSSCPQSLPELESFPMSQLFVWGGQSTGVSALASFLPKKSLRQKARYPIWC